MYLNEAQLSLTGYVATQPVVRTVKSGATNLSMRVAWTPRRQDRVTGEWADGNTSYVTVICWRRLATNGAVCLRKGDPVVVKGRLSIRNYEDKQGVRRIAVEVEASSVGHDLSRGVAQFQRVRPQTGLTATEFAASNGESAYPPEFGQSAGQLSSGGDRLGYPGRDESAQDDPFFHDADLAGALDVSAADDSSELPVSVSDGGGPGGGPGSHGPAGSDALGDDGPDDDHRSDDDRADDRGADDQADAGKIGGDLVGAARGPIPTPF
jgi:single-strand DNA-binding protein